MRARKKQERKSKRKINDYYALLVEKTRHEGNQPVYNELPYIIAKHFSEIACKSKSLDAASYCSASVDMTNRVHGTS